MTHVLQPLDQIFGSFKKQIQVRSHHWHGRPENAGRKLDQYTMMKTVVYEALEQVFSKKENIQAGFRKTGLFPWNKIQPDRRKLRAGTIYKKDFVHDEVFPFPPGSSGPPPATAPPPAATISAPPPAATVSAAPPPPAVTVSAPSPPPPATTTSAPPPPAATAIADLVPPAPGSDILPETDFVADYAVSDLSLPGPSSSAPLPASSLPFAVDMDREASTSSTATLPTAASTVDILLADQAGKSFAQKQKILQKFEATLCLDDDKKEMFEELYAKAHFNVPHAEYQSWLILKQQAVGTEQEAFDRVLASRLHKDVPKKKSKRTNDMPKGGARYEPQHEEFYGYFERCEERKNKGKRKVSPTSSIVDDAPPALVPAKRQRRTGPKS